MTLTSPPNHIFTLDEPELQSAGLVRQLLPVVVHIALMLLLLYWFYSSQQAPPASKATSIQKLWPISQSFFVVCWHLPVRRLLEAVGPVAAC